MAFADSAYQKSGGKLSITNDIYEASTDADVIYAKSWGSTRGMDKAEDKEYRKQFEKDWCISDKHFSLAKPVSYYMHPPMLWMQLCNRLLMRGTPGSPHKLGGFLLLLHQQGQDGLLGVQAVLRLVVHDGVQNEA